jgi:crossover junction endonuclease EME1
MHEEASPVPGVIRFKRHVQARWDSAVKRWLPLDVTRWEWENTVLVIVTAEEIVDKIAADGGLLSGWASDVRLALGLAASDHIIVMVKGLQKYYAKTKSLANREFTAAARAGLDGAGSTHLAPGARVPKETIERELVKLQVGEGCFLVHGGWSAVVGTDPPVEKTEDIEDWVFNLAADVAIRPVSRAGGAC